MSGKWTASQRRPARRSAAALRTDAAHGGQVQLEAHVAVAGVTLGNADALAVLTAVQNPTILGGTQAGVRLVAPWKNDSKYSHSETYFNGI